MTRKTVTALVTLAVLGLPTIAYADADASDTIIVSALRTPVDADRVPSSVTAIDQVAIERAQPLALTDALVATPGIALARAGGYGQVTTVRIRGADPSQSVVVIDGMVAECLQLLDRDNVICAQHGEFHPLLSL